jgi:hypothetical protein
VIEPRLLEGLRGERQPVEAVLLAVPLEQRDLLLQPGHLGLAERIADPAGVLVVAPEQHVAQQRAPLVRAHELVEAREQLLRILAHRPADLASGVDLEISPDHEIRQHLRPGLRDVLVGHRERDGPGAHQLEEILGDQARIGLDHAEAGAAGRPEPLVERAEVARVAASAPHDDLTPRQVLERVQAFEAPSRDDDLADVQ